MAYGPNEPCARTTCDGQDAHAGGVHLDPASDLYDGPDLTLRVLPIACQGSAQTLLHTARREGWDRRIVETALHEMANEIQRLRGQVAAAQVDRDRGIREASRRAEDCDQHGADLRFERHQSYWFSSVADRNNEERIVWLMGMHRIEEAVTAASADAMPDKVRKAILTAITRVGSEAARVRRRSSGPTHADCQRAGRCEHPPTAPHDACRQLALDIDGAGA